MEDNFKVAAKVEDIMIKFCALEKLLDEIPNQNIADILRSWSADVQQYLKR